MEWRVVVLDGVNGVKCLKYQMFLFYRIQKFPFNTLWSSEHSHYVISHDSKVFQQLEAEFHTYFEKSRKVTKFSFQKHYKN